MEDSGEVRENNMSVTKKSILKGTWVLCMFFTAIFIIVAIIAADDNEKSDGGYQVIGFAGIWSAFMMVAMMSLASQVVFDQWSSPFVVGSLIGSSLMFAQMQFVLMIVYFVFADHAKNNEHDVDGSDRALGAFSLFTMASYLLFAIVLASLQSEITGTSGAPSLEEEQRMMDRSGSSGSNDRNDKAGGKYSIEDKDESDVVDIDLEENETF